jgi:hypothetical protein
MNGKLKVGLEGRRWDWWRSWPWSSVVEVAEAEVVERKRTWRPLVWKKTSSCGGGGEIGKRS